MVFLDVLKADFILLYVSLILRTAMFEHTTGNYGHFISSLKIKTTFTLTC